MLSAERRAPAAGGKPLALVVLLHGIGADGQDLIGFAAPLGDVLPHAAFVAPDAPYLVDSGMGRQWFVRDTWDPAKSIPAQRTLEPAAILNAFIDAELNASGLSADKLAFFGFSQGAMMALQTGLHRASPPAAIVACSGALPGADAFAANPHNAAPVLLIHGAADDVVPVARLAEAETALRQAKVPVQSLIRPRLAHGIDDVAVDAAATFLGEYLTRP